MSGEKEDKIKRQEAQFKRYIWVAFFVATALFLFFWLGSNNSNARSSTLHVYKPPNSNNVRHAAVVVAPNEQLGGDGSGDSAADAAIEVGVAADEGHEAGAAEDEDKSQQTLISEAWKLDSEVRKIKATGVIMETDPESLRVTKQLQDVTRKLLKKRYGDHEHYRVKVDVEFPPTHPDYASGNTGTIVIEMAPIEYIPVSVYNFLEVARTWKGGAFHRNAGHVLQVRVRSGITRHMPFQEYSPKFPHKKGTTGYCGRPSGPCWYVSIQDNTMNHGPGSQQKHNPHEADCSFGTVVEGMDDVVPKIHKTEQMGWLDKDKEVLIPKMTILVSDGSGGFAEYFDPTSGAIMKGS